MADLQLGIPITIGGEEVIIFRDTIGTDALATGRDAEVFTVIEHAGPDGRPPIYIDENELGTLRKNFPGTNVYGLWQLLFANNLVPLGHEVVVFPTSEAGGVYLQMQNGTDYDSPANIKRSSEYTDNYSADLYGYDLLAAPRIRVDITDLVLPSTPAFTRVELFSKKQNERTKRWYLAVAICFVTAVATVGYNYTMYTVFKMNMAEYTTKKKLSSDLDLRAAGLLKERLQTIPNDEVVISRVDKVVAFDPKISTPTAAGHTNGFTTGHVFITRPDFPVDLSGKIPGVTAKLMPQMSYLLTVSPESQGVAY
ncbi:hypothetical protein LCG56_27905 (plasmid) [Pseudomonas cannabina pv. alisalensis]|uniref:Transmembrane protein n=1 Tax=Pseudomonas syringae pv. maculicola str. ES4326 TaxID=629265 RepID=A0A8T8CBI5_PSEYM|nr:MULTISPECIES: hypothetical protein [Pseudomonas syringae group]QHF00598.1 hypothetical protein PMA4326_029280 [Pseudomonas syringae pv. maculicola str. ES4326]UBZ00587.1 hypothetical protein LCG56_27905 [Pseudomonas cannabina pv. alisalensis]